MSNLTNHTPGVVPSRLAHCVILLNIEDADTQVTLSINVINPKRGFLSYPRSHGNLIKLIKIERDQSNEGKDTRKLVDIQQT